MSTSVGMKTKKKQPAMSAPPPGAVPGDLGFERSLLFLENVCEHVLNSADNPRAQDEDHSYWLLRFKNIVTPVSLALAEYKGPRRFHNHYRHREDDASVLHPVLEPPIDMLAQVAESALQQARKQLVGFQSEPLTRIRAALERGLRNFLLGYRIYKVRAQT